MGNLGSSILGFFKKSILGSLTSALDGIMDLFNTLGGITKKDFSPITNGLSGLFGGIKEKLDEGASKGSKGATAAVEKYFEDNAATLGLDEATLKTVKEHALKTVTDFFADGVPKLNENNRPFEAYKSALKLRNQLMIDLIGDGESTEGALDIKLPNRDAVADRIATMITGVPAQMPGSNGQPADTTAIMLAANPPTAGLIAVLANLMVTMNAEGFDGKTFQTDGIVMNSAPAPVNTLSNLPTNSSITNGTQVNTNGSPNVTTSVSSSKKVKLG